MTQRKPTSKTATAARKARSTSLLASKSPAQRSPQAQAQVHAKKKRKHNQKYLDQRQREQVDRDALDVLRNGGRDQPDEPQHNPFAYTTSSAKEQRKTARQMNQTLEAFNLLMKQM
ncbi:uncharacterized protein PFL1_00861 [Pseudozyma flocculosa PF-1]|uniref:Uncharacterized protein n=1 Tax=Pseudozyma flocculosa TaxID=84751 RepID=A0A5C3F2H4_9BASI|nr:uncharacterized protein PFL1_00861 [Pseudozyma flocculosa PF-1]EPQ31528.1 hypothetical protein PFL1_00861 [Pseudozyma flocculosa PF-1]SPO38684.1 uncharacterized protein PSFLO_04163 [Pseudozyma flocculosa]